MGYEERIIAVPTEPCRNGEWIAHLHGAPGLNYDVVGPCPEQRLRRSEGVIGGADSVRQQM